MTRFALDTDTVSLLQRGAPAVAVHVARYRADEAANGPNGSGKFGGQGLNDTGHEPVAVGAGAVVTQHSQQIARQGEEIYRQRLKDQLEKSHRDEFVAIEPQSGDYFLGKTLGEAIEASRRAYPERLAYAVRVGHPAAVHLGAYSK